jgi:hypothetical protein
LWWVVGDGWWWWWWWCRPIIVLSFGFGQAEQLSIIELIN